MGIANFIDQVLAAADMAAESSDMDGGMAFAGETEEAAGDGWTKPHFFVSNPGYFAAYFIAGFLAKEIYRYADREGRDLFDFIRNEICSPGTELEYEVLLEKVLKS